MQVQRALRAHGHESEIFAEYIRPPFEQQAYVHTAYGTSVAAHNADVLLYHMALGSNVADWLMDRAERLVLRHHNITPVDFYSPWPGANTYGMAWGRRQLSDLGRRATLGMAVSEYNRRELEALHYNRTALTPVLVDFAGFERGIDDAMRERLGQAKAAGGADWLFVGWIAPHKCQHDTIRAFALYRRLYDPDARLHLVGRSGLDSYTDACEKVIAELGVGDAVVRHGRVRDGELGAIYRNADVLVSMSEHEGVGLPLLEAMHHGVPVVAFAAAAVPETVGDAGVLLPTKKPATVAAAVHRVVTDAALRASLIDRARERVQLFGLDRATHALHSALESLS